MSKSSVSRYDVNEVTVNYVAPALNIRIFEISQYCSVLKRRKKFKLKTVKSIHV